MRILQIQNKHSNNEINIANTIRRGAYYIYENESNPQPAAWNFSKGFSTEQDSLSDVPACTFILRRVSLGTLRRANHCLSKIQSL